MSTSKKITLWSTKNKRMEEIESTATTWGELRPEIEEAGFDTDSLAASESVNSTDLVHKDAKLPEVSEFTVFLRPKKTKSGAEYDLGYKDAKKEIKSILERDGEHAEEHFNKSYGKNYTHMGTKDLNKALNEYTVPTEDSREEAVAENASETVADAPRVKNEQDLAQEAISALNGICSRTDDEDICERVDDIVGMITGLQEDLPGEEAAESEEDIQAREEREARDRKRAELEAQAEDHMDGYND